MVYVRKDRLPLAIPKTLYRDPDTKFMYVPSFHLPVSKEIFEELVANEMLEYSGDLVGGMECWDLTEKGRKYSADFEFNDRWAVLKDGRQIALDPERESELELENDILTALLQREA